MRVYLSTGEILFLSVAAAGLLAVAVPVYIVLRRLIVRGEKSLPRSVVFTLVCGAIVAPGFLNFGHPPPIPCPGGVLLGLFYLWHGLRGQWGGDVLLTAYFNLGIWALVTACIGLGELWRRRRRTYFFIRERAVWPRVLVFAICVAAVAAAFLAVNGPVGEPVRLQGRVIACGPQPHWLTRIERPSCAAELSDGSIHSFEEADRSVYGRAVTVLRFQRRFAGTHEVLVK